VNHAAMFVKTWPFVAVPRRALAFLGRMEEEHSLGIVWCSMLGLLLQLMILFIFDQTS
jgi:hypothetical protein